jgi:diguanylate cyclase (GGDEF)-like protein
LPVGGVAAARESRRHDQGILSMKQTAGRDVRAIGQDQRPIDDLAALALSALNNLDRAVAVLAPDGRILFTNRCFGEAFTGEAWVTELRDRLDPGASETDRSGPYQIAGRSGRNFRLATMRIPQGLLVTAEEASRGPDRAADLARLDSLTLLGSRPMFRACLTELLAGTAPTAAVLKVGLDRFKLINNSLGRGLGDALLRNVAGRIRAAIGPDDVAARLGDDEFGIIQIGQAQPRSATVLAARLVDLLGRTYLVDGHVLDIGACVGVALVPGDGTDCDQILKDPALALHHARQAGRGATRFFETAMGAENQARRGLELDLRPALALGEFALVYQPQLNFATNRITGFEALLRWHHPKRGLVSPADFIPLAEALGLIVPIGEWVTRTACREAAGWAQPLSIAVNVSAGQFASPGLVAAVRSALAETGLDPRRLELEITESVLLGDHDVALDAMQEFRALGIRVSMDDFGTGYSSLSYLRSFPFDKIKIDQSFVRGQSDDPGGMAIIRAVAAMGRSLGMSTLAEGVETEAQLTRIAADGCTDAQGYLISKPLPPAQIGAFLQSRPERAAAPPPAETVWNVKQNRTPEHHDS